MAKSRLKSDRVEFLFGTMKSTIMNGKIIQQQRADAALFNAKRGREATTMKGPGAGRHIADIPEIEYHRMVREANGDEEKLHDLLMRFIMNPDNAHFRVWGKSHK